MTYLIKQMVEKQHYSVLRESAEPTFFRKTLAVISKNLIQKGENQRGRPGCLNCQPGSDTTINYGLKPIVM